MTAIGKYNSIDSEIYGTNSIFVVGVGSDNTYRKNAINIDKSGNTYLNNNKLYLNNYANDDTFISGDGTTLTVSANNDLYLHGDDKVKISASNVSITLNSGGPILADNIIKATVNNIPDVYLGCPIGTIVMWAGTTSPDGWLLCDGGPIDVSKNGASESDFDFNISTYYYKATNNEYRNLCKVLKMTYGCEGTEPYGITAIKLPDLQQKFPLGAVDIGIGKTTISFSDSYILYETGGSITVNWKFKTPSFTFDDNKKYVINVNEGQY